MLKPVFRTEIKTAFLAVLVVLQGGAQAQLLTQERHDLRLPKKTEPSPSQILPPLPDGDTLDELAGSDFAVHLASYHDERSAEAGWAVLIRRHDRLLASYEPFFRPVDLGEKGIFVRLLAGPVASRDAARGLCADLRRAGAYCAAADLDGQLHPQNQGSKR